ncbi:hypothetical protein ACFYE9_12350 [Rhizobium leguminosarum]|nr:hypothetical protein [Rhizobium leguminosarum]
MKTVKVLKERKIADRTLLHLHGDDRSWRELAACLDRLDDHFWDLAAVVFTSEMKAQSSLILRQRKKSA